MARLVLVGLPGVGKTTLARALAAHWKCPFLDTDELIGLDVGVPAAQYLRDVGEASFRMKELGALRVALESDAIVATGAGVVTTSDARELIEHQFTLWLDCDDATLIERVSEGERPLLGDDHRGAISELRERREAWYRSCARQRVDASGTIDDVLRRVLEATSSIAS